MCTKSDLKIVEMHEAENMNVTNKKPKQYETDWKDSAGSTKLNGSVNKGNNEKGMKNNVEMKKFNFQPDILDDLYHCDTCGRYYKRRKYLVRHCKVHFTIKPYCCSYCRRQFTENYQLVHHVQIYHSKHNSSLGGTNGAHMSASTNGVDSSARERTFPCLQCGKSFYHKGNLTRHMKIHARVKQEEQLRTEGSCYSCTYCKRIFKLKTYLERHLRSHLEQQNCDQLDDNADEIYSCEICNKTFRRKDSLSRHVKLHSMERPFCCEICNEKFRKREHLSKHRKKHDDKMYICKHCNQTFKGKEKFLDHFKAHAVETNRCCKICHKHFRRYADLVNHIEKQHFSNSTFICNYCYDGFNNKYFLLKHMHGHVTETPFMCNHCKKFFKTQNHLIDHMRMDQDERPFCCDYCSKRFKKSTHLNMHIKSHTNDRQFICDYCGKRFIRGSQLNKHLKIHTRNLNREDEDDLSMVDQVTLYPNCTVTISENSIEEECNEKFIRISEDGQLLQVILNCLFKNQMNSAYDETDELPNNRYYIDSISKYEKLTYTQVKQIEDMLYDKYLSTLNFRDTTDCLTQYIVDCISTHFMCL